MSEPDVSELLTVAQAIAILDAAPVTLRVEEVSLHEADGRVLAEPIVADRAYPPFDKSLMDGFAVRCEDVARAPLDLRIVGDIPAGQQAARGLAPGAAMSIMTGAPLPPGADGIIPVEDTERVAPDRVHILRSTTPGRFIARHGSDIAAGAIVLESGTSLAPAQLAAAASVGAARVRVFAKPRAAVLATGDELIEIEQTPSGAHIRNSNSVMLLALLRRMGCDVIDLGVVRDEPQLVRDALSRGLQHELLFVTGGMSMGEYDYVPRTLLELGVNLRITKLRIKPGKPFVYGVAPNGAASNQASVFGLPGNPVSAFVCTVRLASRLVRRMTGLPAEPRWTEATLESALTANGPREFYQPVLLHDGAARPLQWKGSADVFTLARANGLLARAENEPALPAGARVRVLEVMSS